MGYDIPKDHHGPTPAELATKVQQVAGGLTFRSFSGVNRRRCEALKGFGHALEKWSASEWLVAVMGELGESANIVKKLNRDRDGIPGNSVDAEALRLTLADELADTFIYLDLLVQSLGLDLSAIVVDKFARTSAKIGYE